MPITRSSDQKSKTLQQFYEDLKQESNPHWHKVSQAMLAFISMVDEAFLTTKLWGLTSHERLVIQAEDHWESPWYVTVRSLGTQYDIQYIMPAYKAPWPFATVSGSANSLEEARRYLLIAMNESEGWKGNQELQELLSEIES